MARLPRLSIANQLHLLVQRARSGQQVLIEPDDLDAYQACLRQASASHRISVHAFALTRTEVRLLVTPPADAALGAMLQSLGRSFVPGFNRRHLRSGPLWDGRFRSTVVEPETYFLECLRFIELAPVQHGLAERAEEWPWSSAIQHAGKRPVAGLTEHAQFWAIGNTPFEREAGCRQLLERPLDSASMQRIERAVLQGWALGSSVFIESLARLAPRRVVPLPRGRRPSRDAPGAIDMSPN
jgi:putative transposase